MKHRSNETFTVLYIDILVFQMFFYVKLKIRCSPPHPIHFHELAKNLGSAMRYHILRNKPSSVLENY